MEHNYDVHVFESRESLMDLSINRFVYYSGYVYNFETTDFRTSFVSEEKRFSSNNITKNLTVSQMQYLSRKLRYSIPKEDVIEKISAYVDKYIMEKSVMKFDEDMEQYVFEYNGLLFAWDDDEVFGRFKLTK